MKPTDETKVKDQVLWKVFDVYLTTEHREDKDIIKDYGLNQESGRESDKTLMITLVAS